MPFNDTTAADRGKHDQSTYIELAADPTTAANEVAVYSKDDGGNSRLYMRQESNGTVIQLSGANPSNAVSGHTFLPGDLLLQWGQHFPVGGLSDIVTVSFPVSFGAVYSVTATPVRNGTSARGFYIRSLATTSVSQFQVRIEGSGINGLFWMAIGTQA